MKTLVALVAVGLFAVSFAARADCTGSMHTVSKPVPATTALDTVTPPATPKTDG